MVEVTAAQQAKATRKAGSNARESKRKRVERGERQRGERKEERRGEKWLEEARVSRSVKSY